MPTLWLRALRLAFVFTFLLGCAGGARHAAAPPPPRPSCGTAPSPGVPYFCAPSGQPDAFVAGLRPDDGWDRGDWVMLDITIPGIDQPVPAAMVEVTERYPDLAKVHLLYQTEARSLVGARARRIRKDDRARLGKFVARITQVDLARVRIDVGALDKAVVGDVYAILSPRDHTLDRAVCRLDRYTSPKFTREWWTRGGYAHLAKAAP